MRKIVTHPLYIRCKKVIESCETKEQLETAIKYCKLAAKKTSFRLCSDLGNMDEWCNHKILWSDMTKEAKWNSRT